MRLLLTGVVMLGVLAARPALGAPIVITTSTDAVALTSNLVGAGVTVVAGSQSLIGATTQQGTFTGGTGILPFESGVILTTGSALSAPGPNTVGNTTTVTGTGGDAALTALAGQPTFDRNVLSFSFIPTTNVISFQFVFGSEEYHEFVGSPFNDVFAFFLNGVNIALVPGTATPISVNNVNCTANASFYAANSNSSPCFNPAQAVNTQYDGLAGGLFAVPLFATGPVNPGFVNTLSLRIADSSDSILDSAVFLASGSFVSQPPPAPVPEPVSLVLFGTGLAALGARRWRQRRNN